MRVERLALPASDDDVRQLALLLADAVESGASVSFLAPMTPDAAERWWRETLSKSGERALFVVARDGEGIAGTVQLQPAWPPNQRHRGEIAKLLVHRRARGRGAGKLLMQEVERGARERGFTLLTLDTVRGDAAEKLYRRAGWTEVGVIPGYAVYPDGKPCDTVVFYKQLRDEEPPFPDFSSPALADAYDELPLWSAMFGQHLLSEVPLSGVKTALDVGCGTGFPLIELAERLGPSADVHGIDPWTAGLHRAQKKIAQRGTRNATLHEGSATSLPFAGETFDLIVSNLGVNNFDDREAALRECRRVARRGATIALTTNLQGHMRELYDLFASLLQDDGDDAALARLREHVAHRATIDSVTTLLRDAGFAPLRVVEREESMRFASGSALFTHYFVRLGFVDGWRAVAGDRADAVFPRLIARLGERAAKEGELRFTIPMAYVEGRAE